MKPSRANDYIPYVLDVFLTVLISATIRLKESLGQGIVFSVTNGTVKSPKSMWFPSVVKALCNNVDVVKLINKYDHGVSYDLVEEIETLFTLDVISKQRENRVVLSVCVKHCRTDGGR